MPRVRSQGAEDFMQAAVAVSQGRVAAVVLGLSVVRTVGRLRPVLQVQVSVELVAQAVLVVVLLVLLVVLLLLLLLPLLLLLRLLLVVMVLVVCAPVEAELGVEGGGGHDRRGS